MSFFKKSMAAVLLFAMLVLPVQTSFASGRTPILNKSTVTVAQMKSWARSKGATKLFIDLAQTFYDVSVSKGVDPAVTYAQSAKETAYMHYTGVVNASYKNPCGLKITQGGGDYDIHAHKIFSTWTEGITAQVDHLALYAGQKGYPKSSTPDPRHFASIRGTAPYVEDLGAKWAPSPNYGNEVVVMMKQIQAQPGGSKPAPVPTPVKPAPAPVKPALPVERVFGANRYETADKINQITKPNASTIVIANGTLYADAMVGMNLAVKTQGHLYISRPNNLNPSIMKGISSGQFKKVYVIGDKASFMNNILKQLRSKGASVERVEARNRNFLAEKVANQFNSTTAILVNGNQYADAISISPVAAKDKLPLYLTNGVKLSPETKNALQKKKKVILVGGEAAISKDIERQLQQSGVHVQRVYGSNRYETSLAVANFFYPSANHIIFATGNNFADVLTGTDLASAVNSPILLVGGTQLSPSQRIYIGKQRLKKAYVLGGSSAVSDSLFKLIQQNVK